MRAALGDLPLRRDLLIEHLHALQHARHGCLREGHLVALAELLRLAAVEVFEVASFYAHFEVLADDAPAPAPATIRVCDGLPCAMAGARRAGWPRWRQRRRPARACCAPPAWAPATARRSASVGHRRWWMHATPSAFAAPPPAGDARRRRLGIPRRVSGRVAATRCCESRPADRRRCWTALERSGLRGLGGAGFPAARKWRLVLDQPGRARHLVVNADEGEPGTFKDRWCLETAPHRVLEGMLLAAVAIERRGLLDLSARRIPATCCRVLRAAHRRAARRPGLTGGMPIHLRRGAGAYICGEETALLESLEGTRGYPRHKPPFPGERGLFGQPTADPQCRDAVVAAGDPGAPDAAARYAAAGRRGATGRAAGSASPAACASPAWSARPPASRRAN